MNGADAWRSVRATLRFVRALLVTAWLYSVWFGGHVVLAVASQRRARWRRALMRRWCASMCAALGVRIEVVGTAPRGGVFLVSNHLSYLDILVLGSALDTVFVSKAEIADWFGIGFLARRFGTIFVARGRKRDLPDVVRAIAVALEGGDGVVVFPEGTSTNGAGVIEFRTSLLAPAAQARLPVHTATLSYGVPAGERRASDSVCWWGDAAFVPHAWGLLKLRAIDARLEFGAQAVVSDDRKQLAEALRAAIAARFRPVR